MKMSFTGYLEAADRSIENPKYPLPIPCISKSCEDEVLDYDVKNETYICSVCDRTVSKGDTMTYLYKILDGKI